MVTDVQLIQQMRRGSANGLQELLKRYQLSVYNYVLLLNRQEQLVTEKYQSLCLDLVRLSGKRMVRRDAQAWLFQQAHLRKSQLRTDWKDALPIEQKLTRLTGTTQELIFLRQRANLRWPQIGTVLGKSIQLLKFKLQEGVFMLADLTRGQPREALCVEIQSVIVDFIEAELVDEKRSFYLRHVNQCDYCQPRILAFRRVVLEISQCRLVEVPQPLQRDIIAKATPILQRYEKAPHTQRRSAAAGLGLLVLVGAWWTKDRWWSPWDNQPHLGQGGETLATAALTQLWSASQQLMPSAEVPEHLTLPRFGQLPALNHDTLGSDFSIDADFSMKKSGVHHPTLAAGGTTLSRSTATTTGVTHASSGTSSSSVPSLQPMATVAAGGAATNAGTTAALSQLNGADPNCEVAEPALRLPGASLAVALSGNLHAGAVEPLSAVERQMLAETAAQTETFVTWSAGEALLVQGISRQGGTHNSISVEQAVELLGAALRLTAKDKTVLQILLKQAESAARYNKGQAASSDEEENVLQLLQALGIQQLLVPLPTAQSTSTPWLKQQSGGQCKLPREDE